jgi:6,7-dimethyl-8-ribityllumazine synthase
MNQSIEQSFEKSGIGNSGTSPQFAFIQSQWHREIVDQGRDSFLGEMARCGVSEEQIDLYEVAGAFEIPLHTKRLANTGCYAAIVACGLVVDGGIYRHEFVATAVITALMNVQLDTGIPVISAVLTPQNFHEHADHKKFFLAHFRIKGCEAAAACLQTVSGLAAIGKSARLTTRQMA